MKLFINNSAVIFFFFSLLNLQLGGKIDDFNKDSLWELKLEIKVMGNFKSIKNTGINGAYNYNVILKGNIGLDEDKDFMYYFQEGKIKDFELKYFNSKTDISLLIKEKNTFSQHIEFIIRNGRNLYLEFITENLDISEFDKDVKAIIKLPISYGILNRRANRKYRKGIKNGSNKISWEEHLLYSKLNFQKNYSWEWTKISNKMVQSHYVDIQLYIKIK